MPAAAHTGAIAFGLVYIPVKLYSAVSENRVSFNQLNKATMNRIGYKKYDKGTGEEVASENIIRGYEYEKGNYVVLSDEELEDMKSPRDKALTITQFVENGSIHPLFYDASYYVVPDGSNKAFTLLHAVMRQENCVAVATTILGTSDTVLAITPIENGMLAHTLHYQSEIKPMPMPIVMGGMEVSDREFGMAKMLVQSMRGAFDPNAYHDAYEEKLRDAIQAKIAGRDTIQPQEQPSNVIDLMDALQRSLAQRQSPPPYPPQQVPMTPGIH